MVSTAQSHVCPETFHRYAGATAGVRHQTRYTDLAALALRVCAGAATLGLGLSAMTPTAGQPNTASSDRAISGSPPDLVALLPPALTNQVSIQRAMEARGSSFAVNELRRLREYRDGWNGPKSRGAVARSFEVAEQFARLLHAKSPLSKIEPTIFADGSAVLEISGARLAGLIRFRGDGSIEAALDAPEQLDFEWSGLGDKLPTEISTIV